MQAHVDAQIVPYIQYIPYALQTTLKSTSQLLQCNQCNVHLYLLREAPIWLLLRLVCLANAASLLQPRPSWKKDPAQEIQMMHL